MPTSIPNLSPKEKIDLKSGLVLPPVINNPEFIGGSLIMIPQNNILLLRKNYKWMGFVAQEGDI